MGLAHLALMGEPPLRFIKNYDSRADSSSGKAMVTRLFLFFLSSSSYITLLQSRTYTPRNLQHKCPWVRCLYGEQLSMSQNTRQIHTGRPPWMCGHQIVRASAEDSTEQNTDKGHTPNPRIGIKIPDPAGIWTRATGLEGRDFTDQDTATDELKLPVKNKPKLKTVINDTEYWVKFAIRRKVFTFYFNNETRTVKWFC